MVKRKFYKAAPPPFYMGDISAAYKAPCTETIIIIVIFVLKSQFLPNNIFFADNVMFVELSTNIYMIRH